MDTSDNPCGTQLSQEHDGQEPLVAFLSHTFRHPTEMSTMEQEVYGMYYVVTKWNYYLQGSDIVVPSDH